MKRQVSVCLTLIFLAVLFSGCGSNVDEITSGATGGLMPDTTPPFVLSTAPTGSNVPVNTAISVTFSEPVTNVNSFSLTVVGTGTPITGTFASSGSTVMFIPAAPLAFNTTYTITITTAVTDFAGNPLASGVSSSFTTGAAVDTAPPTVLTTAPTGTNVPANTLITATFSEQINCLTITATSFNVISGGVFVTGTASCTGTAVTFTPSPALANNTLYTATLSVAVTDLAGNHLAALKQWSFTTVPADAITTTTLPPATETGAYSQTLSASGGTLPLSWSETGLPSGLSINPSTGVISGAPDPGTSGSSPYSINVTVTDAVGATANKTLSLTVNPPPSITSPSAGTVAPATQTGAYALSLTAAGGTGTLTWNATGLPTGLSISPSTGLASSITGTVTDAPGTYDIGLTVTDTNLVTSPTVTLSLTVNAAPTITTVQADLDAAPATAGSPYAGFTPTFTGGTGTMTWNVTGLPASMTFDPATGAITGTPDSGTSGPHSITFTITDSNGAQGSKTLTLTVT